MQRVLYFSSTRSQIAICGRILSEISNIKFSTSVQLWFSCYMPTDGKKTNRYAEDNNGTIEMFVANLRKTVFLHE